MAQKIPVSTRALIQRINRKLKPDSRRLCSARGRAKQSVGDFYLLDYSRNFIADQHVNVAALAKELGCLEGWERLEEGEQ